MGVVEDYILVARGNNITTELRRRIRGLFSTLLLVSEYRVDCAMWMNRGHYSDAVLSEL